MQDAAGEFKLVTDTGEFYFKVCVLTDCLLEHTMMKMCKLHDSFDSVPVFGRARQVVSYTQGDQNLFERVYTKSTGSQLEDIFLNKGRTRLYTAHTLTPLTRMGTHNHHKWRQSEMEDAKPKLRHKWKLPKSKRKWPTKDTGEHRRTACGAVGEGNTQKFIIMWTIIKLNRNQNTVTRIDFKVK